MRTPLTRALVAVLAPAIVLGIANLAPAGAAPAAVTGTPSTGHAAATSILDQVVDAFSAAPAARSSKPAATTGDQGRDVTLLLRDLSSALPSLSASERATAQKYLARPTDGGGDNIGNNQFITLNGTIATYNTTHFLIHYQSAAPLLGPNQKTTLTQVKLTADKIEEAYKAEVTKMGFRAPRSDSATASPGDPNNPNGKIDVYLADLGGNNRGLYGYVSTDDSDTSSTAAPYMVLDNDFKPSQFGGAPAVNSLKVTVAHEFFHAVQFAYDYQEASWFLEATAVWMEDQVYPTINDYLQYLGDSQITQPGVSLNANPDPYAGVIFWKFLSERFHDTGIIRDVFNKAAVSAGNRNGRQAVAAEMVARKTTFSIQFGNYASWNTLPAGSYADRRYFPAFKRWFTKTLGKGATTGSKAISLNHLASSNFVLYPGSSLRSSSRVKVTVNGPNRVHVPTARVQVRYRSGAVTTSKVALDSAGNGSTYVPFGDGKVSSVVVTLSNASAADNSQAFRVRATAAY
ncbi:MAG: hypothetical protein JWQ74_2703 [Marmoricola sp.]|nr:hypothetical protein [Marmoricola sp.]